MSASAAAQADASRAAFGADRKLADTKELREMLQKDIRAPLNRDAIEQQVAKMSAQIERDARLAVAREKQPQSFAKANANKATTSRVKTRDLANTNNASEQEQDKGNEIGDTTGTEKTREVGNNRVSTNVDGTTTVLYQS